MKEYRLRCLGRLWVLLSVAASVLACIGFYLPYWIKGKLADDVDTYFSSFRRCNYPRLNGNITEIVQLCARYSRYEDIPSGWWQISTVLVGVGAGLTLVIAVACLDQLIFHKLATPAAVRILGIFQFISGALISVGCAVYPMGWDNREVKTACGPSVSPYNIGDCELCWSALLLGCAIILLCILFLLTISSSLTREKLTPRSSLKTQDAPPSLTIVY